jgi:hypothetical protein
MVTMIKSTNKSIFRLPFAICWLFALRFALKNAKNTVKMQVEKCVFSNFYHFGPNHLRESTFQLKNRAISLR